MSQLTIQPCLTHLTQQNFDESNDVTTYNTAMFNTCRLTFRFYTIIKRRYQISNVVLNVLNMAVL
jgi:hypothetical protein